MIGNCSHHLAILMAKQYFCETWEVSATVSMSRYKTITNTLFEKRIFLRREPKGANVHADTFHFGPCKLRKSTQVFCSNPPPATGVNSFRGLEVVDSRVYTKPGLFKLVCVQILKQPAACFSPR